jgi:hypothetical protein
LKTVGSLKRSGLKPPQTKTASSDNAGSGSRSVFSASPLLARTASPLGEKVCQV